MTHKLRRINADRRKIMSVHIDQVLEYLDTHLVCRCADRVESLLGMIRDVYMEYNETDSEEIRYMLGELGAMLETFPSQDAKRFLCVICQLCQSSEQLAFSQGILVGMQLMTEVNRLP